MSNSIDSLAGDGVGPVNEITPTLLESKLEYPRQFLTDVLDSAKDAQNRIQVLSLAIADDHATGLILHQLEKAAGRGVAVELCTDFLGQMQVKWERFKDSRKPPLYDSQMFERLKAAGAKVHFEAHPGERLFDFWRGTQHGKLVIVDNCAWVGGMNMTDAHFRNIDFMVKLKDPAVVSSLSKAFRRINDEKSFEDYSEQSGDDYTLLVDGGRPGQSIGYEHALEMVRGAKKKIIFVCQYPPRGKILSEMMTNTEREVVVVTSDEKTLSDKMPLFKKNHEEYKKAVEHMPHISTKYLHGPVHAKLVITDDKEAIWGSNNFYEGQEDIVGWHEISIKTSDEGLVQQFINFIHNSQNNHDSVLV